MASILLSLVNPLLPSSLASLLHSYYAPDSHEADFDPDHITLAQFAEAQVILMTEATAQLPAELAIIILDFAEYWPSTTTKMDVPLLVRGGGMSPSPSTFLYLETEPLGVPIGPGGTLRGTPRKVVFNITSRDQGFCNDQSKVGTYNGAYSWFETSIFRQMPRNRQTASAPQVNGEEINDEGGENQYSPMDSLLAAAGAPVSHGGARTQLYGIHSEIANLDRDLQTHGWTFVRRPPSDNTEAAYLKRKVNWILQRNLVAGQEFIEHTVEWEASSDDGRENEFPSGGAGSGKGFVNLLRREDRIGIWARAMYPAWVNSVSAAEVRIYYAL